MTRRLYWVAMTYVTRPACWFFLITGLLLAGLILRYAPKNEFANAVPPLTASGGLRLQYRMDLGRIAEQGKWSDVTTVYLGKHGLLESSDSPLESISIPFDKSAARVTRYYPLVTIVSESPAVNSDRFLTTPELVALTPNVRTVSLADRDLTPRSLELLAAWTKLEALNLENATIQNDDWAHLTKLVNLREIDFTNCQIDERLEMLRTLPRLERLIFRTPSNINDDLLLELGKLPHLKSLVLFPDMPADGKGAISARGIRSLADSTSLTTIYVGGGENTVRVLRQRLPEKDIERAEISISLYFRMVALLVGAGTITAILSMQLQGQLGLPDARLNNRFATPHLAFAAVVVLAWMLASPLLVLAEGGNWMAIGTIALGPIPLALLLSPWCSYTGTLAPVVRNTTGLFIVVLFVGPMVLALYKPAMVEAYLRGDYPVLIWLFLGTSLLALASSQRWMERYVVQAGESRLDPRSVEEVASFDASFAPLRGDWSLLFPWRRWILGLLSRTSRQHAGFFRRVALVRIGNIHGWDAVFAFSLYVQLSVAASFLLIARLSQPQNTTTIPEQWPVRLLGFLINAAMISVLSTMAGWRLRIRSLAAESLRPVERHQHRTEILAAIFVDLVPFIVSTSAVTAFLEYQKVGTDGWSPLQPFAALAVLVGAQLLVFSFSLLVIAMRETWRSIGFGLIAFGILAATLWTAGNGSLLSSAFGILVFGVTLITLGVVATWAATQKWKELELGLYG